MIQYISQIAFSRKFVPCCFLPVYSFCRFFFYDERSFLHACLQELASSLPSFPLFTTQYNSRSPSNKSRPEEEDFFSRLNIKYISQEIGSKYKPPLLFPLLQEYNRSTTHVQCSRNSQQRAVSPFFAISIYISKVFFKASSRTRAGKTR